MGVLVATLAFVQVAEACCVSFCQLSGSQGTLLSVFVSMQPPPPTLVEHFVN